MGIIPGGGLIGGFTVGVILASFQILVGPPKMELIAACRQAIKDTQYDLLPKLIKYGAAS